MLNLLSPEDSRKLCAFFLDAGYTETTLRKHLAAAELPSPQLRNHARLHDRTSGPTALNALLRMFWIGDGLEAKYVSGLLGDEFVSLLLASGLVHQEGSLLVPDFMLLHVFGFLVVSDHPNAILRKQAEMVLWPNPTSKLLMRFSVHKHSRATLDLGTGSGILSLAASAHSDTVVATDLTERAVICTRFNARLNGVENIEAMSGDCFAPVAGRRFDLILSNPPFFITPQTDFIFCENPMDLDGLCRRLVKEAPSYLNEGGFMQILCEWAQIKGESWEDRVAEWLRDTGCDAWVMKGLTQDPEEYAQHRIRETSLDPSGDSDAYAGFMNYYRHRGVESIHDGLIVMRRRTGRNWVRIETVPTRPSGELGEMIVSTFAAHDQMQAADTDEKLGELRPKMASNARLEQICVQSEGHWKAEKLTLRMFNGFQFNVEVQPLVADFLVKCDGTRTVADVVAAFAESVGEPLEKVQAECLGMIRRLIERGFMTAE